MVRLKKKKEKKSLFRYNTHLQDCITQSKQFGTKCFSLYMLLVIFESIEESQDAQ